MSPGELYISGCHDIQAYCVKLILYSMLLYYQRISKGVSRPTMISSVFFFLFAFLLSLSKLLPELR